MHRLASSIKRKLRDTGGSLAAATSLGRNREEGRDHKREGDVGGYKDWQIKGILDLGS